MSIRNKNDIRVYSELPSQINLVGQHKEYVFPPCVDGQRTMNYVSWEDIEYANSRGVLFSSGLLIFDESEQEEIYNELHIKNWKDTVWFDKDIIDAIENPTLEKMQRIINVTNMAVFERIRGKVVLYTNQKKNISQNVVNIVNARYREICAGILSSKIVVRPTDVDIPASSEEVADLRKQLAEMQKLMEKMVSQQGNVNTNNEVGVDVGVTTTAASTAQTKKPTRKSTNRK